MEELEKIDLPFDDMKSEIGKEINKDQVQKIKLRGKLVEQQLNQLIDYVENDLFEDTI